MSTPINSYRPKRHYRSVFREGKFLLNTEATEIQLEVLDRVREQIRESYGPLVSIQDGMLVEADTVVGRVIIRPGYSYIDGYPVSLTSAEDPLYGLGSAPNDFESSDFIKVPKSVSDDGGIALNLGGASAIASGDYQVVLEIREQLITAAQDPFLRSANLSESTADRHRVIVDVHLIPKYIGLNPVNGTTLNNSPIPYRGIGDNNFVDYIEVTASGSNYSIVSSTPLTGAEAIDGRNLELEINNGNGGSTAAFPLSNTDIREFIHGKLIDSNGTEFHISNMFVTPGNPSRISMQIDLEKTRPVNLTTFQTEPVITDGVPYRLVKRDLFVTSASSLPEGRRYYPVSEFTWNGATISNDDISDLRPKLLAKDGILSLIRNGGTTLYSEGDLSWDETSGLLTWPQPITIDTCFEGFEWSIASSDTNTLFGGFSSNEVLYVDLSEKPLGGSLTLKKETRGQGELVKDFLRSTEIIWVAKRLTNGDLQLNDQLALRSSSGIVKVDYHDPISSSLPTGTSVTIDGVAGVDGDRILFTNLASDNNRIYELSGVGVSISWTPTLDFNQGIPEEGDRVSVTSGEAFREALGIFRDSEWRFNDTVRYYSGADYWEQSSLKTSDITASTTDDIFTVTLAGSENMVIDYSLSVGTEKETGVVIVSADATDARSSRTGVEVSSPIDVDLFVDVNAGNLRFRYTNNEAQSGNIKYSVKRWSNSAGGPGGVPSYSGSTGSPVTAAGVTKDIQFKGVSGNLDADSDFQWDSTAKQLSLGDLKVDKLQGPLTINDNQTTPTQIISYDAATYRHAVFEYSIERAGENRVGRLTVVNNGTVASITDDSNDTGGAGISDVDIPFTVSIVTTNVVISYTSNSTGNTGEFKYSSRRWS